MNSRDLCIKDIDSFEEERPLLRKEDRKALVRRHNQLIRLYLCEIGVDREVESDSRRERVFACQSDIKVNRFVYKSTWIRQCGWRIWKNAEGSNAAGRLRDCHARY